MPILGGGTTYKFARFAQKLDEIKKNLVRSGEGAPEAIKVARTDSYPLADFSWGGSGPEFFHDTVVLVDRKLMGSRMKLVRIPRNRSK